MYSSTTLRSKHYRTTIKERHLVLQQTAKLQSQSQSTKFYNYTIKKRLANLVLLLFVKYLQHMALALCFGLVHEVACHRLTIRCQLDFDLSESAIRCMLLSDQHSITGGFHLEAGWHGRRCNQVSPDCQRRQSEGTILGRHCRFHILPVVPDSLRRWMEMVGVMIATPSQKAGGQTLT